MANVALDGIGAGYLGTYASKILLEPMFHSDDIMSNYTIYPAVVNNKKVDANAEFYNRLASKIRSKFNN